MKSFLRKKDICIINLSREDLASLIGTATESVIISLSEFKNDHLIPIKERKITLLDIKGLLQVANLFE